MVQVLGVVVAAFSVLLVVGAITGRVKITSCCAVAAPQRDTRMKAAFAENDAEADIGARRVDLRRTT